MTIENLNLKEAWVKMRCRESCSLLSEIQVQLSQGVFSIGLESFMPADIPLRSITSLLFGSNASNIANGCGASPVQSTMASDVHIDETGGVHLL